MDFEYSPYIANPPASPKALYDRAASNDAVTVASWRDIWVNQMKANHAAHGPFKERGIGKMFKSMHLKPCIVVGSGPSLKLNVDALKNTKGIPVISCLHNYQFLEDRGVTPDYYVTLDAGPVTIEEVSEGGKENADFYWKSTKNKKLLAFVSTHPDLLAKWQGEISFFNAPIPDGEITASMDKVENFGSHVSSGGNVLGASFYIAKAIFGANPVIFVGADFSFSYVNKFHGWDSKYDKNIGQIMLATDVFGNRVKTWASYYGFKCWIESRACTVPGLYINATEGGILGAYPEGNISQIRQMSLDDVINMYSLSDHVEDQMTKPDSAEKKILF
jgi:hypothetical protein